MNKDSASSPSSWFLWLWGEHGSYSSLKLETRCLLWTVCIQAVSLVIWAAVSVTMLVYVTQILDLIRDWHYGMMDDRNPNAMLAPLTMNRALQTVYTLVNSTSHVVEAVEPQAQQAFVENPQVLSNMLGYVDNLTTSVSCETVSALLTNVREATGYVSDMVKEVMEHPELIREEVDRGMTLVDRLVTVFEWVKLKMGNTP